MEIIDTLRIESTN